MLKLLILYENSARGAVVKDVGDPEVGGSPYHWYGGGCAPMLSNKNEKVSNRRSIPITIDCNVVAFIVFEEGFHQPIKRTKQSVFLDGTVFRHTFVD
ncbi:hypothetical protein TNCV_5094651 [Trichonephila clavipes]|nr:hypothetical protein TNCV_5094651 [Trichonephila clavipes]